MRQVCFEAYKLMHLIMFNFAASLALFLMIAIIHKPHFQPPASIFKSLKQHLYD